MKTTESPAAVLRKIALKFPGVEVGIACKGTSLESQTFRVNQKNFLFLRPADLRLKLGESLSEAKKLAAKEPTRFKVGAGGWVFVSLEGKVPSAKLLALWIEESYQIFKRDK